MALYCGEEQKEALKYCLFKKKVIRLITGLKRNESCRQIFKEKTTLMVTSLYVLQVMCFIEKYKGNLKQNSAIHEHNSIFLLINSRILQFSKISKLSCYKVTGRIVCFKSMHRLKTR
jgi:hypothetical protein